MIQMRIRYLGCIQQTIWDIAKIEEIEYEAHEKDQVFDEEGRRSIFKIGLESKKELGAWNVKIELHEHCFLGGEPKETSKSSGLCSH